MISCNLCSAKRLDFYPRALTAPSIQILLFISFSALVGLIKGFP